jgi:hypothetical protein
MNELIEAFLRTYYTEPTKSLADLLVRYLDENPDGLASVTARFQKLIQDASA